MGIHLTFINWLVLAGVGTSTVVLALTFKRHSRDADEGTGQFRIDLYGQWEPMADFIKTALQMIIGVIALVATAARVINEETAAGASEVLLVDIGLALAAAAVVELAYTLFTPGPDEALNPLLLGVSAAILIQLNREPMNVHRALVILILSFVLGALFLVRVLLVGDDDAGAPKIWWAGHADAWLNRRSGLRGQPQADVATPSEPTGDLPGSDEPTK